jgi:nitrogen regulatory protein PII-like uncharacterized protein
MPKSKTEITVITVSGNTGKILKAVERRGMAGSFLGSYTGLDV